jgi:predicted dehydrogenase
LLVEGERGSLRMDADGRMWTAVDGEDERAHDYVVPGEGYRGDSVGATQRHLIDCLRSGRPSESEGRDYLNTVRAVIACYDSAAGGRVVRPGG